MKQQGNKRELLLRAAGEVVSARGVEAMTLEAVAERTGVSKGGLLYHFPSKESLIAGMVSQLIEDCDTALETEIAREAAEGSAPIAGRWLRAYVRVSTAPKTQGTGATDETMAMALIAALVQRPAVLEVARAADARWQVSAENDGIDPDTATVIRLAADGCWMGVIFGFTSSVQAPERLDGVRRTLLDMIDAARV